MMTEWTRRTFLGVLPAVGATTLLSSRSAGALQPATDSAEYRNPPGSFPSQDPEAVREIVSVSHGNLARVRELVEVRPALAKAAVDWGYGDWETALGAASHTGRREIAELLIAHGARPDIFAFAMLGDVGAVRAMCEARSGIQRIRGPHSIALLAHAKAGGEAASEVVKYLESLGDADAAPAKALDEAQRAVYLGLFAFGTGETEKLIVDEDKRAGLQIKREGGVPRRLTWVSEYAFHPAGAEAVRIVFAVEGGRAVRVVVHDPAPIVVAKRIEG